MADLKKLADQVAEELLKAILSRASKVDDDEELLNLAQAYSLIVSAEVEVDLVGDDELFSGDLS